jgi:hypothetical protein
MSKSIQAAGEQLLHAHFKRDYDAIEVASEVLTAAFPSHSWGRSWDVDARRLIALAVLDDAIGPYGHYRAGRRNRVRYSDATGTTTLTYLSNERRATVTRNTTAP